MRSKSNRNFLDNLFQEIEENPRSNEALTDSDSRHPQWESLDMDVVFSILEKLWEAIDLLSFGAVCREWYRVAKAYKRLCKPKVLPMLLVPRYNDESTHEGLLYGLSSGMDDIYVMLPERKKRESSYMRYYRGCGHGWVAMIEMDSDGIDHETIITLFNPITTPMRIITLPPKKDEDYNRGDGDVRKVILSEDPTSNPDIYMVVAFSDVCYSIAIIKGIQERWDHLNCRPYFKEFYMYPLTDAIFYRGKIYMADLQQYGIIDMFDYKSKPEIYCEKTYTSPPGGASFEKLYDVKRSYLVESTNGDLFYILRYASSVEYGGFETKIFRVYKVVLDGYIVDYVEVKSIGDEALFVGNCHSVSFVASSSSGYQPNSIYFADASIHFDYWGDVEVDMGIFHLEDGNISKHANYPGDIIDAEVISPPLWIIPPVGYSRRSGS